MKYLKIAECDTKNGIGCRVTIWFSGCRLNPKCGGCFNSPSWDCNNGDDFTEDTKQHILNLLNNEHIAGLTITGGNPTDFLEDGVILDLVDSVKDIHPNKDIWLWSGNTFEELVKDRDKVELLSYVDVLVDGRFISDLRDISLKWAGSSNQRCIDVQQSLHRKEVVIWEEKQML